MIYWDNNATTPLAPEVYAAMEPFLKERFFNPSSGYSCAREVREAVEEARAEVAALLGAFPSEIVFTSGGTEATNAAFRQMAGEQGGGIGVLATDHDASLKTALAMGADASARLTGKAAPCRKSGRLFVRMERPAFPLPGPITRRAFCRMRRPCVPPPGGMGLPCIWIWCSAPGRFL